MKFRPKKRDTIACPDVNSSFCVDGIEETENGVDSSESYLKLSAVLSSSLRSDPKELIDNDGSQRFAGNKRIKQKSCMACQVHSNQSAEWGPGRWATLKWMSHLSFFLLGRFTYSNQKHYTLSLTVRR
jgi:hypothetical protein